MMNSLIYAQSLSHVVSLIAPLTIKAAIIILLATLVVFTWRSATAATRHWIWLTAIAGVFLLLPLSMGLPEWQVPVRGFTDPTPSAHAPVVADVPAAPLKPPAFSDTGWPKSAQPMVESAEVSWSWVEWVGAIWALGAGAVVLYFLLGMVRAWIWTRRSAPVTDAGWTSLSRDLRWMVGINRDVELRWHRSAVTPMTWGLSRPVILLPRSAMEWSPERRRVVLLHELAHIRRLDCLSQSFVQITCALNWFNPLMWFAASRMQRERERACDDYVLHYGAKPSSYASHLLEIARGAKSHFAMPVGAVAMARRSELEGRLMAILEPTARRGGIRVGSAAVVAILFLSTILPLAAFTPTARTMDALDSKIASDDGAAISDSAADDLMLDVPPALEVQPPPEAEPAETGVFVSNPADVVKQRFSVNPGGKLSIDTDLGSIQVRTGSSREVTVEIDRSTRGGGSVDDIEFRFDHSGNDVRVEGRRRVRNPRGLNVQFVVTVPDRYDVDLKTAGGSIQVGDLDGVVMANTSGGSLRFGRISGYVKGRTSGGSITLDSSGGDAILRTSGGSITLGDVQGNVDLNTSGGSITVREVGGDLVAVTSGGSIRARMSQPPKRPTRLETSGGSITLDLHPQARVSVDARTSSGRVTTDFAVPERPRDRQSTLRADINGGGPDVVLRTSAGNIRINRIGATGEVRRSARDSERTSLASVDKVEYEIRMEELGERIGAWAEAFVEQSIEPMVAWFESPEFESWVEGLSMTATEFSLQAVEEALSAIDPNSIESDIFESIESLPHDLRSRVLQRMSRDHPDPEVRRHAQCLLDDSC